jgi:hypothetical protein
MQQGGRNPPIFCTPKPKAINLWRTKECGCPCRGRCPRVGFPLPRPAHVFPAHLSGAFRATSAVGFSACTGGQSLPATLPPPPAWAPASIERAFYFSPAHIYSALFSISGKKLTAPPFSLILLETSQGFFVLVVPVRPRHPRPRPLLFSLSRGAPTAPPAHHLRAGAPLFSLPTRRG